MNTAKTLFAIALIVAFGFMGYYFFTPHTSDSKGNISASEKNEIEKIIHDYLIENPEVLLKASQALQRKVIKRQQEVAQKAIEANRNSLLASENPETGNPDGKVVLIEFFDYQCGHCKAMHPVITKLIADNPDLRVSYQLIPFLGEGSLIGTKAAYAALKQDNFKDFHDALISGQEKITEERVTKIAEDLGLNTDQLKIDMEDQETNAKIQKSYSLAGALGIQATPFFIVMGDPNKGGSDAVFILSGAAPQGNLQQLIDKAK